MTEDIEELWGNFILVGTVGMGAGVGVLISTPGRASEAIPATLKYARALADIRWEARFYGIYVSYSELDRKWGVGLARGDEDVEPYPDKLWPDTSSGHLIRPLVSTTPIPAHRRKGWRPMTRVAGPTDGLKPHAAWGLAQQVWWAGASNKHSATYKRAAKSISLIRDALRQDALFLQAFRHGA